MANKFILSNGKFLLPKGGWAVKSLTTYSITPTLTNVTADASNPTTISKNGTATLKFTANSGYELPDLVLVSGATSSWTKSTGVLVLNNPVSNVTFIISGQVAIIDYLTFWSSNLFGLHCSNKGWEGTMLYSTNLTSWNTWNGSYITSVLAQDNKYYIYLRGTGNTKVGSSTNNVFEFVDSEGYPASDIHCHGNIETLLDYDTVRLGNHPTLDRRAFSCLFLRLSGLVEPPLLPNPNPPEGCYNMMFAGCTSLYASMSQSAQATYLWVIPSSGTFTCTDVIVQESMFEECIGYDDPLGSAYFIPDSNLTLYTLYDPT